MARIHHNYKRFNGTVVIGLTSSGMAKIPLLVVYLDADVCLIGKGFSTIPQVESVAGWGMKVTGKKAQVLSKNLNVPALYVEDGFLRSFGTGKYYPPLSLVCDDVGIYYDSTCPSALENLLNSKIDVLEDILDDVIRARMLILEHRLSKYNHAPLLRSGVISHLGPSLLKESGIANEMVQRVLVVDQTAGDVSVVLGDASADTFAAMLTAARDENPNAIIYIKTHPEVNSGNKIGYLSYVQDDDRTTVLRQDINPMSLMELMDRVYVVTSHMGFEALLAGKPVTCFGMPYYAGWGVTDDRLKCSRRTRKRSVDEIFAAAYFHYTRYLNPITHERGTIFDVIRFLVRQKEVHSANEGRSICVGYRRWKAANIKPLLSLNPEKVHFVKHAKAAEKLRPDRSDRLVYWSSEAPDGVEQLATVTGAKLYRMEDGFVRSVGLGSDLIRPLSLVLDSRGIYFDPSRESDLEHLLNTADFSGEDLERAKAVREYIVEHGITKYNIEPNEQAHFGSHGREVILVPGQVEDDASIRFGCEDISTNLDLLKAARQADPDAFIVYKPHPDVMSKNRKGRMALDEAGQFADHIETHLGIVSCIEASDQLHTMTSLSGFDALLRGKRVVVYGRPFYAGWGLTDDQLSIPRRERKLLIDELVAGALLQYPIYWDWELKGYTTCEAVLNRIVEQRDELVKKGELNKLRAGYIRRQWRKLTALLKAYRTI